MFGGSTPIPFEQYSDDFSIPGYLGKWQIQPQCTLAETYSHPGHLNFTLLGPGSGTGFCPVGGGGLSLKDYPPPWEIEIGLVPPNDDVPWNLMMNWWLEDKEGENVGRCQPGLWNDPRVSGHPQVLTKFANAEAFTFDPEIPAEVLASKPIYFLIQVLDSTHVRIGVRASRDGTWFLSNVFDCETLMDGPITLLGQHCWTVLNGRRWGAPPGAPAFQQSLIDYVDYSYGVTTP